MADTQTGQGFSVPEQQTDVQLFATVSRGDKQSVLWTPGVKNTNVADVKSWEALSVLVDTHLIAQKRIFQAVQAKLDERDALQQQVNTINAQLAVLQANQSTSEIERAQLKSRLNQLNTELEQKTSEIATLKQEYENTKKQAADAKTQLEQKEQDNAKLIEQNQTCSESLTATRAQNAELQTQVQNMQTALQQTTQKAAEAKTETQTQFEQIKTLLLTGGGWPAAWRARAKQ
jgi:chromosome segregation ATPase